MGRSPPEAQRGGGTGSPLRAAAAGILPLLLLVGLRGTGIDADAGATGVLLAGLTGVAVVTGRRGIRRSGFCNRFCPLLPVERLYGQRPLVSVSDDRCPSCSLCTPRGCLDLSETAVTPQLLGPARSGPGWLLTPFGAFAAGFPGFVAAWFWWTAAPMGGGGGLAGILLAGFAFSWVAAGAGIRLGRVSWDRAMPTLAALAAGIYYAAATPRAVAAFGGTEEVGLLLRVVTVGAVAAWWLRALAASREPRLPTTG